MTAVFAVALGAHAALALEMDATKTLPAPADVLASQQQLRVALDARQGAFKELDDDERAAIIQKQVAIFRLLEGKDAIEALNEPQRVELFNHLEWIKAAVTRAEDNRKICEKVKAVGSNRMQLVCTTAGQQRQDRERARDMLERPQTCNSAGCVAN